MPSDLAHVKCPECNVDNFATAKRCTVCSAPLDRPPRTRDGAKWIGIGAGLAVALFLPTWVLGFPSIGLVLATFYAGLLTSYLAKQNVVWPASAGSFAGAYLIVFLALVSESANKVKLAALVASTRDLEHGPKTIHLALGAFLVGLVILMIALAGAAVGDRLAERRRAS